MIEVETKLGKKILCDYVIKGINYPVLHIHTHSLSPVEAYNIFGNPEETKEIITREEKTVKETTQSGTDGDEKIETTDRKIIDEKLYEGYTEIYSVQKSPFLIESPNEILIWLQKPQESW